ncbi:Chalcone-flavanone isomerase family protein, partial [Musa troglodytarum]
SATYHRQGSSSIRGRCTRIYRPLRAEWLAQAFATATASLLKARPSPFSPPLVLSPTPLRVLVLFCSSAMGSEMVTVDQVPFAPEITVTKPLRLLGYGVTDIEIHFLQIKYNAIGIYMEKEIVRHLAEWKGKKGSELAEDDAFFDAVVSGSNYMPSLILKGLQFLGCLMQTIRLDDSTSSCAAPVEKYFRIVVIKEIKGSQYGVQLESAVRDRLAAVDKYEEEEEEALEKVTEFFQKKYFKKDSLITFHFPAASHTAEISFATEGKEEAKVKVENPNVAEMIQKWYLGGTRAVSPTTVKSLADNLGTMLAQ